MDKPEYHLEEKIQAYLDGKLNNQEINELWADLMAYPELLEHLEINAALKDLATNPSSLIPEKPATVTFLGKHGPWILSLAAIFLIAIGLNLFRFDDHPTLVSALDSIDLREMETLDVTRNQAALLTGKDSLLFFAYEASVRNRELEAMGLYEDLLFRYPETEEAAKAKLNMGILSYNKREYEEAISYFEAGLDMPHPDEVVIEKLYWYLGNAYINSGDLVRARDAVRETFIMNGVYRSAAYYTLRQLEISLGFQEHEEP